MRLLPPATLCSLCLVTASPWAQPVQTELAEVISVAPILVQESVPLEDCIDLPQQRQRCRTTTVQQEVPQGYEVIYEYRGRRFTTELPYDPGPTVVVQPPRASHQYGSIPTSGNVQPGRKSYGSAPAAGSTESIEYRSTQPDIPIVVDVRTRPIAVPGVPADRPPHPGPRPRP
ncbi:MAG: hypothetical protein KUL80_07120 [Comamonas sp.]|nr:hypothetical protein [Comamonas sp.]